MSSIENEELISRLKAMTSDELTIVADHIPVELCYNRIGKELKKAKDAKKTILELANSL